MKKIIFLVIPFPLVWLLSDRNLSKVFDSSHTDRSTISKTIPVISAINPASGPYNTVVTITGSGFSNKPEENTVQINGMTIPVQETSSKKLTITVPKGVGSGDMIVTVKGETVKGPVFTYVYTTTVSTLPKLIKPGFTISTTTSTQSYFTNPRYIARDKNGNLYITDGNCIKVMEVGGRVRTLAGSNEAGYVDATGSNARFNDPRGIAVDANGNVFVADYGNQKLRKITPAGLTTTSIKSYIYGLLSFYVDRHPMMFTESDLTTNQHGTLYSFMCYETGSSCEYYLITHDANSMPFYSTYKMLLDDLGGLSWVDPGHCASGVSGIVADPRSGLIYVANRNKHCIYTTIGASIKALTGGIKGFADGVGASARFSNPEGVAVDANGNVYVADAGNNRIRKITPDGRVTTLAGTGVAGYLDGPGSSAQFNNPVGIAADPYGGLYVVDAGNRRVRYVLSE